MQKWENSSLDFELRLTKHFTSKPQFMFAKILKCSMLSVSEGVYKLELQIASPNENS